MIDVLDKPNSILFRHESKLDKKESKNNQATVNITVKYLYT